MIALFAGEKGRSQIISFNLHEIFMFADRLSDMR